MDNNKLADLKAHNQFLIGRLDTCQWALNSLALTDDQRAKMIEYERKVRTSQKEYEGLIAKKNQEAEDKRAQTKAAKNGNRNVRTGA